MILYIPHLWLTIFLHQALLYSIEYCCTGKIIICLYLYILHKLSRLTCAYCTSATAESIIWIRKIMKTFDHYQRSINCARKVFTETNQEDNVFSKLNFNSSHCEAAYGDVLNFNWGVKIGLKYVPQANNRKWTKTDRKLVFYDLQTWGV